MKLRRVRSELAECVAEAPLAQLDYGKAVLGSAMARDILAPILEHEPVEVFAALLLNGKHRVFAYAEVTRGTLTTSLVHPREVFGPALRMGAAALIVAHNHPSGDCEPSAEDTAVTERLYQAGQLLGVPLLDHIIIGADSFVSLRDRMASIFAAWGKKP